MRSRLALLGVLGPACAATSWAGEEGERVHFEYRVPAGCPGEAEFMDLVAGDGGRWMLAGDGEQARTFVVSIEGASSFEGRVAVREVGGTEAGKVTRGDRCEDVVRAVAVLVSLSLEPGQPLEPPSPVPPASAPAAATTPPPPPPAPIDRAPAPRRAATERTPAVPEPAVDDWRPRWRVGFSVDGTLSAGATPGMNPGLAAYVEVVHVGPGYFQPAFRLGGEMGSPWRIQEQWAPEPAPFLYVMGTTKLVKRVLRLDACPLQSLSAPSWSADAFTAQLCARLEAGSLEAEEDKILGAVDARRPWLAAGALLRVRWVLPTFFFEWEAGAIFPLERARFVVEPGNTVFEVPVAAGTTGLGIGVLFL